MKTVYIKATLLEGEEKAPKEIETGQVFIKKRNDVYKHEGVSSYHFSHTYSGSTYQDSAMNLSDVVGEIPQDAPVIQQGLSLNDVLKLIAVSKEPELAKTLI